MLTRLQTERHLIAKTRQSRYLPLFIDLVQKPGSRSIFLGVSTGTGNLFTPEHLSSHCGSVNFAARYFLHSLPERYEFNHAEALITAIAWLVILERLG